MAEQPTGAVAILGMRVRSKRVLDWFPLFTIDVIGVTGIVSRADADMIAVRLDEYVPGAEEWKNEYQITPDDTRCEYEGARVFTTLQEVFNFFFEPLGSTGMSTEVRYS